LYQRALSIFEQGLGLVHPDVATTLNNLAALSQTQGAYEQAELLLQRALLIFERRLHPEHPHVATTLTNLAALYEAQGEIHQAIAVRNRRDELRERLLTRLLGLGAEAEKRTYLAILAGETWVTLSLHTRSAPHDAAALRLALTTILRRKGRVLEPWPPPWRPYGVIGGRQSSACWNNGP
jgi:tetratricopeptide (TPR) repeat protein